MIVFGFASSLFLLLGVAMARRVQVARDKRLGWMSEQWLAEHRASSQQ